VYVDDRVRAISLAMGLVPIMWSSTPTAGKFDTNDWQVPGGIVTGEQSFNTFQSILGNASLMDTGYVCRLKPISAADFILDLLSSNTTSITLRSSLLPDIPLTPL
jgi:hypothetical protein